MKTPASTAPSSIAIGMLNAQEQSASAFSTGVLARERLVMVIARAGRARIRAAAVRLNVDIWYVQSPEQPRHWPALNPSFAIRNGLGSNHSRERYCERHPQNRKTSNQRCQPGNLANFRPHGL